eukprot:CAMPEP_0116138994 /NCGR_PEP_ID=MMETSP0329-20121206/13068_1 /TAXON_ID=697910 /ORGANISM="Pseudo-nitzschia arenysensis, Strain B593" /LENGTH=387 /DNA_ID=CAMNT_0003633993 /DNA_START=111 /DNA_END=1271 /DNA_ORIENTATION=+
MALRRKATPRNDGLPVVNGKKVQRRPKYSQRGFSHHSSSSSMSVFSYLWRIALVVFILYVVVLKNDKGSEETSTNVVTTPAKPVEKPLIKEIPAKTVPPPPPPPKKAAPPPPKPKEGFPPQCTAEQLKKQLAQLPLDSTGHGGRSWRDASFTKATVRSGGVYNPQLVREFYFSDDFKLDAKHAFYGVSIGWNNNEIPVDLLAVGSRYPSHFDTKKWNQEISLDEKKALPPVAIKDGSFRRRAKFLMVGVNEDLQIRGIKDTLKYSDEELAVTKANSIYALGDVINEYRPSIDGKTADDQPVHYLEIHSDDEQDASILTALGHNLDKIRFLHFEYNKSGSWNKNKLSKIINLLQDNGHVCYFAGQKGPDYDLWRITQCFLDHFDENHW